MQKKHSIKFNIHAWLKRKFKKLGIKISFLNKKKTMKITIAVIKFNGKMLRAFVNVLLALTSAAGQEK